MIPAVGGGSIYSNARTATILSLCFVGQMNTQHFEVPLHSATSESDQIFEVDLLLGRDIRSFSRSFPRKYLHVHPYIRGSECQRPADFIILACNTFFLVFLSRKLL